MRNLLVPMLAIVSSLLAATAEAQTTGEAATACVPGGQPISPDYARDSQAEWPLEAQRFKSNEQLVSRRRDRLKLALDGGKSIELVDCPYGAGFRRGRNGTAMGSACPGSLAPSVTGPQ